MLLRFLVIVVSVVFCETLRSVRGPAGTDATVGELRQVHILYRHGDRSPSNSFPTDPVPESVWPQGYGQLSKLGIMQHYELGKYLRNRYILGHPYKLLNETYLPKEIHIRSTDYDRTLMSAYSNLAGLYPPSGEQLWNRQVPWQPIPVHTVLKATDNMLCMDASCWKYDQLVNEALATPQMKQDELRNKEFYQFVSDMSGINNTGLMKVWKIFDALHVEKINGMPLPAWTEKKWNNKTTYDKLHDHETLEFEVKYNYPGMSRFRGGLLLEEIVKNMTKKLSGKSGAGVALSSVYSAHDVTLAGFSGAMKVYNHIVPPLASCIMVELLLIDGQNVVRVMYRNDSSKDAYQLHVQDCGEPCTFDKFVNLTRENIPLDWAKECKEHTEVSIQHIVLITFTTIGLLLVILTVVIVVVTRCKRLETYTYKRFGEMS